MERKKTKKLNELFVTSSPEYHTTSTTKFLLRGRICLSNTSLLAVCFTAMDSGTSNVPLTEDATTCSLSITESVAVIGVLNGLPTLMPIAMKLERSNYNFWKSQIMPTLRAYDLEGFIIGSMICPQKEGISSEYDAVVVNLTSRSEVVTFQEAQYLLQSHEMRLEQLCVASTVDFGGSSANFAARKGFKGNYSNSGQNSSFFANSG
ncbi:WD repeat domain-containing protein [Forsythia ovata]|uniref:WD repeat domain-containing protein n=1 Tax=Forsythia ovata TaxID=205694 RepID=A0ABD1VJ44_9LAMI